MRDVNRSAIIVIPKQPFLDWLHSVDPTSADLTLDDLAREPSIYLIQECEHQNALRRELHRVAPAIFEEQLDGWWTDRSDWPARRIYANFRRWFPVKHYLKKLPFYRALGASVLESCDAVLFTCEEELRLSTVAFRSSGENRHVIRYGIDVSQSGNDVREDIRVLLNQLKGKRKLLFFGRIHHKKGPDMLIEAFGKICIIA